MNLIADLRRRNSLEALGRLKKHGFDPATLANLRDFIARAADRELYQANPRYLAERLSLDQPAALGLLAAAVAERLFNLHWQVTCPVCGKPGRTAQTLGGVAQLDHCENCGHDFEAHLDDEVSISVSVNESLRRLSPAHRDDPAFRAAVDARLGSTPALALINLPTFRELVTDQILPEGQSLGVRQLAIFFSDLRCSTAFYHKFGDAAAYQIICQHFLAVFKAVARHNGAAVKTIGDGIMGVFGDASDALRGLAEALTTLEQINDEVGLIGEDRLALKVGLHVGPCVVVTLNRRLDYFGETVNIAARLGGLAQGGDVVLSHAALSVPEVRALAERAGDLFPLTARLRGLPENFELHRWAPAKRELKEQ